jgi:glycosyltransferase involved in cell wall biosynthesis
MQKKVVWILNHYAQIPGGAGGTRHYGISKSLSKIGWDSYLIAASVDHVSNKQKINNFALSKLDVIDGVNFLWIKVNRYRGNKIGRLINIILYSVVVLMPNVTKNLVRPNVVVGSSVHPLAAISAWILSKRFRVPFIFEVRDLWPQTLIDYGKIAEDSFAAKILKIIELFLYKKASKIITLLPNADVYIEGLGVAGAKISWIPNGVDYYDYKAPSCENMSVFKFMYLGAHGEANDLYNIINAMKYVPKIIGGKAVILELVGNGVLKKDLIEYSSSLKLDNIIFKNAVPKNEVPNIAASADAFILSVMDKPNLYKYGISMNKIYDYMMASRPIIICSNASNDPIAEAGAGISVRSGDPIALAKAIEKLVCIDLESRIEMGKRGRMYVESNNSFSHLAEKFSEVLIKSIYRKQ